MPGIEGPGYNCDAGVGHRRALWSRHHLTRVSRKEPGTAPGAIAMSLGLDRLGEPLIERLEEKNARREAVLELSRELVRHAARSIHAAHRREWEVVDEHIAAADEIHRRIRVSTADHADIGSAGYTLDAEKEYAEAYLTRALIRDDALPGPEALEVDDAAWLNGLGEAAGELRRAALDAIRHDDIRLAERLLERMDEIYAFLQTIDLPGRITRDIKRTNDMVRGVTERTRGDLTVAARQERLERALARLEARLGHDALAAAAGGTIDAGPAEERIDDRRSGSSG